MSTDLQIQVNNLKQEVNNLKQEALELRNIQGVLVKSLKEAASQFGDGGYFTHEQGINQTLEEIL